MTSYQEPEKTSSGYQTQIAMYLDIIGWSPRQFAEILGIGERSMWRWLSGQNPVPEKVMSWLKMLAEFHMLHNLPEDWKLNAENGN